MQQVLIDWTPRPLMPPRRPVVLSLGGGLDSWVLLLEAVRRGEHIDIVVFVDVGAPGDPGEWPSTYRHVEEVVRPFCVRHGIEFVRIDHERYPVRDARSLFQWLWDRDQIPVAGDDRICTIIAKVERFERWLDDRFAGREVEVWIGFDANEQRRVDKDPNAGQERRPTRMKHRGGKNPVLEHHLHNAWLWTRALGFAMSTARRVNRFPLIEWKLCRCRCEVIARASGFPVPRKSACVFCPYGSKADWVTFARELPNQFELVVELERKKPLTKENQRKLSIMAYDSRTQMGTPLRVFVARPSRPKKPPPCPTCGAPQIATKATGCTYLSEAA